MACYAGPLSKSNNQINKYIQLKPIASNGPKVVYHAGNLSKLLKGPVFRLRLFSRKFDVFPQKFSLE
jgi:hypothetical protein